MDLSKLLLEKHIEKIQKLQKENAELKSKLKKLKKKIENGLRVEVEFRGSFDFMPEIEMCDSKWDRFKDGKYYGRVVIEE